MGSFLLKTQNQPCWKTWSVITPTNDLLCDNTPGFPACLHIDSIFSRWRNSGPYKLELARNDYQENLKVSESQLLGKFHLNKPLVSQTTSIHPTFSLETASSVKQIKKGNISGKLREIVPANRSHLTPDKHFRDSPMICSSDINPRKRILISSANQNIDGLDGDTGELIAPCSSKKPSLLITGPNQSKDYEFEKQLKILVKSEHLQVTENVGTQNHQENVEVLVGDEFFAQKKNLALTNWEHLQKEVVSQTVPHNDEKRGSAFLSQVREKLNDAEYKEFVNFMKALKSKAMKIGHVLQSIARLFSFPDRISLLHGTGAEGFRIERHEYCSEAHNSSIRIHLVVQKEDVPKRLLEKTVLWKQMKDDMPSLSPMSELPGGGSEAAEERKERKSGG
ncbi:regulator of telomere elongation helicase 1 homolog [Primulina eburnea]|uniref:regulator of telomere elongation helicase 1 homolog n=1 Tax=Primulina eburnea TaxID=1245227 RepID=UPI003C6BE211